MYLFSAPWLRGMGLGALHALFLNKPLWLLMAQRVYSSSWPSLLTVRRSWWSFLNELFVAWADLLMLFFALCWPLRLWLLWRLRCLQTLDDSCRPQSLRPLLSLDALGLTSSLLADRNLGLGSSSALMEGLLLLPLSAMLWSELIVRAL
jgi:hypothetical protein